MKKRFFIAALFLASMFAFKNGELHASAKNNSDLNQVEHFTEMDPDDSLSVMLIPPIIPTMPPPIQPTKPANEDC